MCVGFFHFCKVSQSVKCKMFFFFFVNYKTNKLLCTLITIFFIEVCYFSNFVKSADLCSDDNMLMMQPFSVETRSRRLCVCVRESFLKNLCSEEEMLSV